MSGLVGRLYVGTGDAAELIFPHLPKGIFLLEVHFTGTVAYVVICAPSVGRDKPFMENCKQKIDELGGTSLLGGLQFSPSHTTHSVLMQLFNEPTIFVA